MHRHANPARIFDRIGRQGDGAQQAIVADVDQVRDVAQAVQGVFPVAADGAGSARQQSLAFVNLEGSQARRRCHRRARVGIAVENLGYARGCRVENGLLDVPMHEHAAHGHGATVDRLGGGHDVRCHPELDGGEDRPGAAKAGDHLVEDQQDIVAGADLAQALQVTHRRRHHAAGADDGLHHHRANILGAALGDEFFQGIELVGALFRQPATEGIGGNIEQVGQEVDIVEGRKTLAVVGNPLQRSAADIDAVVAPLAGDEARLAGLAPCALPDVGDLHRGLDRLGSRVGEEHPVESGRRVLGQLLGEAKGHRRAELERRREIHFQQLPVDRIRHLAPAVAEIDAPEPGGDIEHLAPVRRVDEAALGAGDQAGVLAETAHIGKRLPPVAQIGVGHRRIQFKRGPGSLSKKRRASQFGCDSLAIGQLTCYRRQISLQTSSCYCNRMITLWPLI